MSDALPAAAAPPPPIHAMRRACKDAFLPYLRQVLEQNPPERHAGIKEQFAAHMDFLADFCLRGYPGAGGLTVEFIKGLHRAMFPPDFKRAVTTREGAIVWLIPGEFKTVSNNVAASYLHPGKTNAFTPAAEVPQAMARLVADINRTLAESEDPSSKADTILAFMDDFFQIHPFVDGNGRVAFVLADLLAVRAGIAPFRFGRIKHHDDIALVKAMELRRASQSLYALHRLLEDYDWPSERQTLPTATAKGDELLSLKVRMRAVVADTFAPYLRQVLEQNPPERHVGVKEQFAAHMDFLADFCLRGYPGAGGLTVEFIKGLHRACFPPDFVQKRIRKDGTCYWLVPGEFKTVDHLHGYVADPRWGVAIFYPAAQVPAAMVDLVARANAELSQCADANERCAAVLWFFLDFLTIHPFADANSRVACILADLTVIRAGLAPFHFHGIKSADTTGLILAVELAREQRDLGPVYAILAAHGWHMEDLA